MDTSNNYLDFIKLIFIVIAVFIVFITIMLSSIAMIAIQGSSSSNTKMDFTNINTEITLDYNNLSSLSGKYESNGNVGTIANNAGDPGGKSYGAFQLASSRGSIDSFLIWLHNFDCNMYDRLIAAKNFDGGYGYYFDLTWTKIAKENIDYLYSLQYNYIKQAYFDVVVNNLKSRIDFTKRTKTLQNVVWSTAVQHGTGGATSLIGKLDLNLTENLADDANLIKSIYAERRKVDIYFYSSSRSIKNAVYNRFINEENDALGMLKKELGI